MHGREIEGAACLAMCLAATAAAAAGDIDFSGDYVMRGKGSGANESASLGTCTLKREAAVYQVSCYNQDTRHTYVGKGLAAGDTLAISSATCCSGTTTDASEANILCCTAAKPTAVLPGNRCIAKLRRQAARR